MAVKKIARQQVPILEKNKNRIDSLHQEEQSEFDLLFLLYNELTNGSQNHVYFDSVDLADEDGEDWGVPSSWAEECVALFECEGIVAEKGELYAECTVSDVTGRDLNEGYLEYRKLSKNDVNDIRSILKSLISSNAINSDVQLKLSSSKYDFVRIALASNDNLTNKVKKILAKDSNVEIQKLIRHNHSVTKFPSL